MADSSSRLSLRSAQAAVKRLRAEGERHLSRLRRDTDALFARSRRQAVAELLGTTQRQQADFRHRAERALRDLDARRTQILATVEKQVGSLTETLIRRLHVASREEVGDLQKRLAGLEQRVGALATVRSVPTRDEVAALRQRIAELELRLDALVRRAESPPPHEKPVPGG